MLKKLALVAAVAGILAAVRKRSGSATEADLWHEATRGPGAREALQVQLSAVFFSPPLGPLRNPSSHGWTVVARPCEPIPLVRAAAR